MDVYLLQHKERTTIIMTNDKKNLFQAIMDFTNIHHENILYLVVEALQ